MTLGMGIQFGVIVIGGMLLFWLASLLG